MPQCSVAHDPSDPTQGRVTIETRDGITEMFLDRPRKKNALDHAMYDALSEGLTRAAKDPAISAILLAGRDHTFCAGHDLAEFLTAPPRDRKSPVFRFLHALVTCDVPIVAAVEGHAVGIGATMLLHCDFVYAGTRARFAFPFIELGVVPEAASTLLLPRVAGPALANELLLLGRAFAADQAKQARLVHDVVDDDSVLEQARALCRQLAGQPVAALRATKRLLRAPLQDELVAALYREADIFIARLQTTEVRERLAARLRR